ncbi:GNAT family N-acetyltransferase [Bacillus sp. EB106-08-02-XG196]|uniref:GNAT family N-acetyltransferase n=1 Tax=Bacillus sp. EB106-08-02-XG196 TaxID=2737049 RepID=UPI0015C473CD|nr:GNAT family N-acetyltransferase [Bacillus sp. EB106-08-02-XG196]NWQ44311.1 GNAT family N-acetyltransferase [Bacillus sp. EB106-08-02-XG196]
MQITFENIFIHSHVVAENNLYKHFHFPEMLSRYDSNYIEFKTFPTLVEFKNAESYLREYHHRNGQKHVKFKFPVDKKVPVELVNYLNQKNYDIGFLELYAIQPNRFPEVKVNPDIEVEIVTEKNLRDFLSLQYQQDIVFGSNFANQKVELNKCIFKDPTIMQLIALYKGTPAGGVDVIISENTVEIDNLGVDEAFQKKGIGSRIQKFVMDTFHDKTVILVADGQDTPKEMYKRQNYQYLGYQYYTQKVED